MAVFVEHLVRRSIDPPSVGSPRAVAAGTPVTPARPLHIDTSRPSPTIARLAVVGEVDLATAPLLRDRLFSVLHDQTPGIVDVDLAGVSFLDCSGIGALVAGRNMAVQTGRQMRVTGPQPATRRLLELTGLFNVLTATVDQPAQLPPSSITSRYRTTLPRQR